MSRIYSEETIRQYLWSYGKLKYKMDPLQRSITDTVRSNFDRTKKICILSSRQIGKSYWVMCFALEYLIRNPGTIARVIAPTREKCEEIVEDNLSVILQDVPDGIIGRAASKNRWNLFNKSSLRIGALERQYVDKNRGGNASLIIYEECGFVKGDDFNYGVNSVIGPQLLRSKGHEIFVSSPSEQPDHPLHTVIAPSCGVMGTLFEYMVFESPSITESAIMEAAERAGTILTPEFMRDMWDLKGKVEKLHPDHIHEIARAHHIQLSDGFRREFMAEIIRPASLMVVPTFYEKETVHAFKVPNVANRQVVIDWGGVRDKTVALLMAYEYNGDVDLFVDERVFEPNTSTDIIVQELKQWEDEAPVNVRWADVPGQLQIDLQDRFDYQVHIPQKTNWMGAVNTMAGRFSTKKVKIHPRCRFLIQSVRAGMFNKNRTDFDRSEALGHMDALAAAMYGIRSQNRENPYAAQHHAPTIDRFVNPDHIRESQEDLLDVKVFGDGPKRFGPFASGKIGGK